MANTKTQPPLFCHPVTVKAAMRTLSRKKHNLHKAHAVRSSLEMTLLLLEGLPKSLEELSVVKALVDDALMASLRLGLELKLEDEPIGYCNLKLVHSQELAS
jgi:hypothetical protein